MIAIAHFAVLVLTTIFAFAAAVLLDWLFLRAMFQLMRPAVAKTTCLEKVCPPQKAAATPAVAAKLMPRHVSAPTTFGAELVEGTRELVRHLGPAAVRR
jgi:hypothetical protein